MQQNSSRGGGAVLRRGTQCGVDEEWVTELHSCSHSTGTSGSLASKTAALSLIRHIWWHQHSALALSLTRHVWQAMAGCLGLHTTLG